MGTPRRQFKLPAATKLGIRLVVSAALLVLLITKIPADDVQPKDTHTGTLLFLAFGLLFTLFGFVLSAWRWQRSFAVFDIHVPLRTLFGHYLAGAIRNPAAADGQFGRLIFGFAVTEALGIFSLLIALLLIFAV